MAFCKIMFIGNLGRDPEMRYMPNGKPVTQFSVAVSHSKPDGQGGWVDEGTDWFRVSVFGDRAERAAEQFRKGMKVFVEGRLKTSEYVSNLAARGSGDDGAGGGSFAGAPAGVTSGGGGSSRAPSDDTDLDDLPF